jgi:hypothetical protein
MSESGHLSGSEVSIGVVCAANLCLMVLAAFYRRSKQADDSLEHLSFVAVFLGLTSQVFYLLMASVLLGWIFLDRDSIFHRFHVRFADIGILLSIGCFFFAWFGRGMRRYASLWVAVTTGVFWVLAGLGTLFRPT